MFCRSNFNSKVNQEYFRGENKKAETQIESRLLNYVS